jgi:immune inhibitor A
VTTGTEHTTAFNAYVAENRTYAGFDDSLRTGPYQFGWLNDPAKQDLVEHFPYEDGLLVWYWDESHSDNNVGDHPGAGLILPVDANPAILHWSDGSVMRPRLQSFDSTFTTKQVKQVTLHQNGVATKIPAHPGVSVFDDMQSYWFSGDPGDNPSGGRYQAEWSSVNVPHTGTKMTIKSNTNNGNMLVEVQPAPAP